MEIKRKTSKHNVIFMRDEIIIFTNVEKKQFISEITIDFSVVEF